MTTKPTYEELEQRVKVLEGEVVEHKKVHETLRKNEERFRTFLDNLGDIAYEADSNGIITYANKMSEKITGISLKNLVGKSFLPLFTEESKKVAVDVFQKTLKGENPEYELCFTNGRIGQFKNEPLRDKKQKIIGVFGIATDITERKRAEEELKNHRNHLEKLVAERTSDLRKSNEELQREITERKQAEEQRSKLEARLQQAQRLEAIGTLAGGIAHDFNNLLMGIQGNISLILMDIDPTHPYYKWLENIEKQIQSGARLTSHLLGYARKGKYEVKPLDLNQMLKEASETFVRTRKEVTIHRELADNLFAVEADSGQIEQLLLNLYVNAADAMRGGGDLILKTMNVTHKDMTGKLYDPKPGKYVLLTVTDTGIGMDKETMERVFDPFFTTKEMGRGTGLGLSSAYGIVKGHGGYIDVDSKKGQGTTFSIYLPASERKVQEAVKTAEPLIKGTGTVLLVDDEEVIVEVGKELLEGIGYRVLTAKDGKEAIEVYEKDRDEIDIVILDMVMPNIGGGEAYDRMKEINPDIKVLLSSGFSIDGEATEILERGCDAFIQKPFKMKDLSRAIRKILGKK